ERRHHNRPRPAVGRIAVPAMGPATTLASPGERVGQLHLPSRSGHVGTPPRGRAIRAAGGKGASMAPDAVTPPPSTDPGALGPRRARTRLPVALVDLPVASRRHGSLRAHR